jgi:hypothetical protein
MQRIFENYKNQIPRLGPRNTVQRYYATDDPKLWSKSNDYDILKERGKEYSYKFNDHGFRCDDFSLSSEFPIVFLGCSNTCGVALQIENTWQYILLDKIKNLTNKKIPLWSLAAAGSSIDRQALLLEQYYDVLKPKVIFFLIPSLYRRLFAVNNEIIEYLPVHRTQLWRPDDITNKVKKFDSVFTEEDYAVFESYKNLLLINQIAKTHNIKVYWESWGGEHDDVILRILCDQFSQYEFLNSPFVSGTSARDGSHAGPVTHRGLAETTFEKIKNDLQSFV